MNKKLFLTSLMLLSFEAAFAQNLPDEINYNPYYDTYESTKSDRDYTENSLNSEKNNLDSIVNSIYEKTNYIATLEAQIQDYQNESISLKGELRAREDELYRTRNDLNSLILQLNQLNQNRTNVTRDLNRQEQSLRPIQEQLRGSEAKLRETENKITRLEKLIRDNENFINSSTRTLEVNKKEIQSLSQEISLLERSKSGLENEVRSLTSEVQTKSSLVSAKEKKINEFENESNVLERNLNSEKAKLKRLISNNATRSEIEAQEKVVAELEKELKKSKLKVSALEKGVAQDKLELSVLNATLNQKKNELTNLPRKISELTRKKDDLSRSIGQLETQIRTKRNEITSATNEATQTKRELTSLERRVVELRRDHEQTLREVNRLKQILQTIQRDIVQLETRESELTRTVNNLTTRINSINSRLPVIDREIAYNKSEIKVSNTDISDLNYRKNQTENSIANLERDLSRLNNETNLAYDEYTKRQSLYNHYYMEAQKIGSSQTDNAYTLGEINGGKIADSLGDKLGKLLGEKVGKSNAKLIGYVRGENSGYRIGYDEGYIDSNSIKIANTNGTNDGVSSAKAYVEVNLKPSYFENHLAQEIKKPFVGLKSHFVLKGEMSFSYKKLLFEKISDLTNTEKELSKRLITSLDEEIASSFKEEIKNQKEISYNQDYQNVFEDESLVPYGSVNCESVYKKLSHFKSICNESYSSAFANEYADGTYSSFANNYKTVFDQAFTKVEGEKRATHYQTYFDKAYELAYLEAKVVGKKDIYDVTYNKAYEDSYEKQIPLAKVQKDSEAKEDVKNFIKFNPIVSVVKSKFDKESLRGGDKGFIEVELKNISEVDSNKTGTLVLTSKSNIILEKAQYNLPAISKKGTNKILIPFVVDTKAASKELISFEATLNLPGDKYKASRVETTRFSQELILNPKALVEKKFDAFPKVKSLFSYYIHNFTVEISPAVESLNDGYEISLKAVGENQNLIQFKTGSIKTNKLSLGEKTSVDLSYTFQKAAKNRDIELELTVKYKDLVLNKEKIKLSPR